MGLLRTQRATARLTVAPTNSRSRLTVAPGLATVCSRDSGQQTFGMSAIFRFCGKDNRIASTMR